MPALPSARARAPGARSRFSRCTGARSLRDFDLQAHFLDALLAQLVHHLQHRLVARVLVAADEHRELAGFRARRLDHAGELRARDVALIEDAPAAVAARS